MNIPFVDLKKQYQSIKKEVLKEMQDVFNTSEYVLGSKVENFEKNFAKYCGAKYCLAVNSGTSALHLALLACNIDRGDEVITQPNTFFATAEAISYTGAKPVFVDINPDDYTIDVDKIEKSITPKTKCILPVHLYGNASKMENILEIAKKHNLIIIEDCCQAHGVTYQGKKLGTFGKVGCFSFYPGKVLGAYGEGGAVITDDEAIYERMKIFRDHGQAQKNNHEVIGYNYRLEGLQGAILGVKLKKFNSWLLLRRKKAKVYNTLLKKIGITTPSDESLKTSNFQYYVIRCKDRDNLKNYLQQAGICTIIHYPVPIHLQKAYKFLEYKKGDFPQTEKAVEEILSLPLYPEIELNQQQYVIKKIKEFYRLK